MCMSDRFLLVSLKTWQVLPDHIFLPFPHPLSPCVCAFPEKYGLVHETINYCIAGYIGGNNVTLCTLYVHEEDSEWYVTI